MFTLIWHSRTNSYTRTTSCTVKNRNGNSKFLALYLLHIYHLRTFWSIGSDRGVNGVVEVQVPESWKNAADEDLAEKAVSGSKEVLDYVNSIQNKINAQQGNNLPVSAFLGHEDGTTSCTSTRELKKRLFELASLYSSFFEFSNHFCWSFNRYTIIKHLLGFYSCFCIFRT